MIKALIIVVFLCIGFFFSGVIGFGLGVARVADFYNKNIEFICGNPILQDEEKNMESIVKK